MSFAPRDTYEAHVQFALERGVPAMIEIMGSQRLPYPARAFDLAHCSHYLIPWQKYDGLYLIEVDRILRPGGYWVLSNPLIHWKKLWRGWERTQEDLKQEQNAIEAIAKCLCWKKVIEKNDLLVCGSTPGITAAKFKEDNELWKEIVVHYKRIISLLPTGRYQNVMDMNAHIGGFAAAMLNYPVWVMNVVPANTDHNTLGVIYDNDLLAPTRAGVRGSQHIQ
ncbi:hypothetical protein V6N13_074288 [Hibiscus sabdariffa]